MKSYEIDIVTEDISLDDAVTAINNIEGVVVVLTTERSFGWPTATVYVTDGALPALEAWYGSEIV